MTAAEDRFEVEFAGESMHPVLSPGAVLECRADRLPQVGDMVVFNAGDQLVAHRVLGVTGQGSDRRWVTAGDGRAHADPPQEGERLLGVVTAARWAGRCLDCEGRLVRRVFRALAWSRGMWGDGCQGGGKAPPLAYRLGCHLAAMVLWRRLIR